MTLRFPRHSFTPLFALLIGILISLILIGMYGFYVIQQDLLAHSGESLALAATDIADRIDRFLVERFEDIDFATQTLALRRQDPPSIIPILDALKNSHPSFHLITLVDPEGRVNASVPPLRMTQNFTGMSGFQAVKNGQAHHLEVSRPLNGPPQALSLIFTKAIPHPSANTQGILIAEIPMAYLEQIFMQTQVALQQARGTKYPIEWQLLTHTGRVLLDSILHEEGTVSLTNLDLPSALLATSGKTGFIEEVHKRRHVPVITGFAQTKNRSHLSAAPWGVLVRIDQSDALPAIHAKIFQLGVGLACVLVPLVAIIFWTARKVETEHHKVLKAETKYRSIFEHAQEGIFQTTPAGQFLSANPAMARMLGYDSPDDLIHSVTDIGHQIYVNPDQRTDLLQKLAQANYINNFEIQFYRRDGIVRLGFVHVRAVQDGNGTVHYLEGTLEDMTERKQAANRLLQLQDQLLKEQTERTQQVEAELGKAKATLITQAKLATLGQISGSIAHELRNPLGTMRNALFLLKRRISQHDVQATRYLDMLEEEIQNSDMIIQGLLEVARGKEPIKQIVSLPLLLDKVMKEQRFPDTVRYECHFDPDPFEIWVDPAQFTQVLHNVLHNACQAMEAQGTIWIHGTYNTNQADIIITDSGPGILEEHRDQLFEPLFTTKVKGTGLGLTLCREIIERHGGSINFSDAHAAGATFHIRLPLHHTHKTETDDKHHQIV